MTTMIRPQERLLVIGAGDIAFRALPWLRQRFRVYALCRTESQAQRWRGHGAIPVMGDLDHRSSLRRLAGLAPYVLYTAPPDTAGDQDLRLKRCLGLLNEAGIIPCRVVYISTTGVYGDCQGHSIDETRPARPESPRAARRVDAEQQLRRWVKRSLFTKSRSVVVLRAPGIYAADRLPLERIRAGTPAIQVSEDSFSNHIHADDLAHIAALALFRGGNARCYNVNDDSAIKMGDWFDRVADAHGLPRVPRLSRLEVKNTSSPLLWSFLRESRQLLNQRMKRELRVQLRYRTVDSGLAALATV